MHNMNVIVTTSTMSRLAGFSITLEIDAAWAAKAMISISTLSMATSAGADHSHLLFVPVPPAVETVLIMPRAAPHGSRAR